jgi:hypothetical protein
MVRCLLDESDPTFGIAHKGIRSLATKAQENGNNTLTVQMGPGEGIMDGGHTYAIIVEQNAIGEGTHQNIEFGSSSGYQKTA